MSTLTSEQAITALEHSSKPTQDLLDDAAAIVGFYLLEDANQPDGWHSSVLESNGPKYRDQWILRWMIKKLSQAVNLKQTSEEQRIQLLTDERTWKLLGYLLGSIPRHASKAIILEREFCTIFSDCLAACTTFAESTTSLDGLQSANHDDPINDRPSKKQKISPKQSVPKYRKSSPGLQLLRVILRVADEIADALSVVNEIGASHRKSLPSNWINSVDGAATFIARLIQMATIVREEQTSKARLEGEIPLDLGSLLEHWVELWHAIVTPAQNRRKQPSSMAFVDHALLPTLDFLRSASRNSPRSISRVLEREIATACVLPMRIAFQKQFAATWESDSIWGSGENKPQWSKIQNVMETLTSLLGDAATGFCTFRGEQRTAVLMDIASRITPASDVARRRADRPWIEALFLCLCLLLSKTDSNNTAPDGESVMMSDVSTVGVPIALPIFASNTCLDALEAADIQPSTNFWHFYLKFAMSGANSNVPIATLAQMVSLNPSVFVPEREDITPSLLNTFCGVLDEDQILDEKILRIALDDVLAPIWEEFGKRRRLSLLIEFWESRLLNTYHLRSNSMTERSSGFMWDHPDLLDAFSQVCQRHAPPSLCTNRLSIATSDIARLEDIVGPTHQVFAKITILGSILKSVGRSSTVQQVISSEGTSICHLIDKAILRQTDYQGHRWRLWKILETFVRLFPNPTETIDLSKLELPWTQLPFIKPRDFDSRSTQSSPQIMELLQSFSCIMSLYESSQEGSEAVFIQVIVKLNELMQVYRRHVTSPEQMLEPWNGLSETMDSAFKLISACLVRLARCSRTWYSAGVAPDDLLKALALLSFGQKDTEFFTDLAVAAEATLTEAAISTRINLLDTYSSTLSKDMRTRFIPPLLHSVAQGIDDEHDIRGFCKVLFETMKEFDLESHHEPFLQYLSLATETIIKHTDSAILALDLKSYVRFLEVGTEEATTEQLAAAYQLIQRSTQQIFTQPTTTMTDSKNSHTREKLLKWTKKQLKEIESSDEAEILNKYTGYLLLAVAQTVHDVDITKVSKEEGKAIDNIKAYHSNVVIRHCRILVEEQPDEIDFWPVLVLLDSLVRPEDVRSVYKKFQKCLQKVVESLVASDGEQSEPSDSNERTRIIAKLWDVLSTHIRPRRSRPIPDFPHAKFALDMGEEKTENALILRAQLAMKHQSPDSIASLARSFGLSKVEELSPSSESMQVAGSKSYLSVAASIRRLQLDHASTGDETIEVLGNIACLQTAFDEADPTSLIMRLELSKMVLEKHPSIVSQYVIDSTLISITILASSACKAIGTVNSISIKPEHIFDRLCTILSTLLVRYRRRLTGRHHLLLPALQNLLKCLFYPANRKNTPTSSSSKVTYLSSLPPWLNSPTHATNTTLPPSSANKFSRLLQQLCDPSASSARHVSKRPNGSDAPNNLTDDVKSLRREVSRHTQYLLQTYCQVMLDGYVSPDVKEKLLPGLYAAMNAMDVEVMRALNTAMDTSQRAIWKDLYAEWRRFGRWNQR